MKSMADIDREAGRMKNDFHLLFDSLKRHRLVAIENVLMLLAMKITKIMRPIS